MRDWRPSPTKRELERSPRHTISISNRNKEGIPLTKYLIINGDDFGMSEGVNRGILEAHTFRTLTSTSLMVNMPNFKQAVKWALQTPTLGVGLHFNLTWGKSISPPEAVLSLVGDDGSFSGNRSDFIEEEIEHELTHQYNKMVSAGLTPTHLDSHHHIHIEIPLVYLVMSKFAYQTGIPLRINPNTNDIINRPLSTDHLILDTYDTPDGNIRLLNHLATLQEGITEIMCHPGYPEHKNPPEQDTRGREFQALTDQRIGDILREQGIQLIHFGHLSKIQALQQAEQAQQAAQAEQAKLAEQARILEQTAITLLDEPPIQEVPIQEVPILPASPRLPFLKERRLHKPKKTKLNKKRTRGRGPKRTKRSFRKTRIRRYVRR